ncbi:ArnT family glycosyltransferase [Paenibacillus dendritiformis]|uniref:ArnT family glycosyltransferase n=1 Tax=Paenibacillus dendritiformis TaxID=130049 RepID=UPI001BCDDEC9|nr:glycosyltransferase family 39 protein [Paenibacillus dendritiformis]
MLQGLRSRDKKEFFVKFLIILIFSLALMIRFYSVDITRELRPGSDELVYHYAAESLLKYGTLIYDRDGEMFYGKQELKPTAVIPPGYPIYVAIIYKLFNHSTQAVLFSQLILSMICLFLIYKILKLLNVKTPYVLVTLLLASVYPGFLYNIERMLTEQLFTTLLIAFVYVFLKGTQNNNIYLIIISAILFSSATHVRPLAFPFIVLVLFFFIIYERNDKKYIFRNIVVFLGILLLFMLPWWFRNWITFEKFILFSESGDNAEVWGAVPYFIDMGSVSNLPLRTILDNNINSNPWVYYKWRIFGFFQYMWGDLWDENLVHPHFLLRPFIILQQVLVVPCIALIPLIIRNCKREIIFISCVPIAFTLMNLPFHGLPRYVYPSVPFVFILAAVLFEKIGNKLKPSNDGSTRADFYLYGWQRVINLYMQRCYLIFSVFFSIVLLYSVYIFAYGINEEMSEYRLSRYMGTSAQLLQSKEIVSSKKYNGDELSLENASLSFNNFYKNDVNAPAIIRLEVENKDNPDNNANIASEITLNIQGGYPFDYMTIYWTGNNTPEITENSVYKFPINAFQKKHKIFIDDDVHSLMIVPVVFRGGEFKVDSIEVMKYNVEQR